MSLRIHLRDEQLGRSIAITTDTHALVFHHDAGQAPAVSSSPPATRCMVEFSAVDQINLTEYKPLSFTGVHGTLGIINIKADVFICVISAASPAATVRPGDHIQRIVSVDFCKEPNDNYSFPSLVS